MLVGEQPGDVEDREGRPFVGPAGMLLRGILAEVGIAAEDAYVTNAVKHFKWRPSPHKPPLEALVEAGLREDRPPEDWLYKVWDGDNLVDVIFRPAGGAIDDEHFDRATLMEVNALRLRVASIDDVLVAKLLAITEQEPDYRAILEVARSLREQVDWKDVEARTKQSPFARAFFTLGEGLGIVERRSVLSPSHAS